MLKYASLLPTVEFMQCAEICSHLLIHVNSVARNPGYDRVIDSLSKRQIMESADNK
jgi:hypothetical protein